MLTSAEHRLIAAGVYDHLHQEYTMNIHTDPFTDPFAVPIDERDYESYDYDDYDTCLQVHLEDGADALAILASQIA